MTARYVSAAGYQVTVVTATADPEFASGPFDFEVARRPPLKRLAELVRQADVVHLNTFNAPILILSLLMRRPTVWQHIDFDMLSPRGICHVDGVACRFQAARCFACLRRDHSRLRALRSIVSLFAKRAAAHAVTVNLLSTEYARRRMPMPRLEMLSFGIETEQWAAGQRRTTPETRVFFYGRHIPAKGCDVLIRAVRRCLDQGLRLTVRIAGDGPHRARSEQLSRQLGLEDTVTFLGFQPEELVRAELLEADIVAIPTLQDEIGQFVAFEAMASGCAVVASSIGAFPEHLDGAGLLFPPGDDAELAQTLGRLAADRSLMSSIARRGRQRVLAEFDWKTMGQRYLDLYRRVAGPARRIESDKRKPADEAA
jgi:glycosyltransferase involved in cell wall biosynthesis